MHEFGLVEDFISQLLEHLKRLQIQRVKRVSLRLGAGLVPEAVEQAFGMLAKETALAGARLEMAVPPLHLECECGYSGDPEPGGSEAHVLICPTCLHVTPIEHAHDLQVLEIDVAEQDEEAKVSELNGLRDAG